MNKGKGLYHRHKAEPPFDETQRRNYVASSQVYLYIHINNTDSVDCLMHFCQPCAFFPLSHLGHFVPLFYRVFSHSPNYLEKQKSYACAPSVVPEYQKRISGPILDRIDIHIEVPTVDYENLNR
jgi:hypothetical protein